MRQAAEGALLSPCGPASPSPLPWGEYCDLHNDVNVPGWLPSSEGTPGHQALQKNMGCVGDRGCGVVHNMLPAALLRPPSPACLQAIIAGLRDSVKDFSTNIHDIS